MFVILYEFQSIAVLYLIYSPRRLIHSLPVQNRIFSSSFGGFSPNKSPRYAVSGSSTPEPSPNSSVRFCAAVRVFSSNSSSTSYTVARGLISTASTTVPGGNSALAIRREIRCFLLCSLQDSRFSSAFAFRFTPSLSRIRSSLVCSAGRERMRTNAAELRGVTRNSRSVLPSVSGEASCRPSRKKKSRRGETPLPTLSPVLFSQIRRTVSRKSPTVTSCVTSSGNLRVDLSPDVLPGTRFPPGAADLVVGEPLCAHSALVFAEPPACFVVTNLDGDSIILFTWSGTGTTGAGEKSELPARIFAPPTSRPPSKLFLFASPLNVTCLLFCTSGGCARRGGCALLCVVLVPCSARSGMGTSTVMKNGALESVKKICTGSAWKTVPATVTSAGPCPSPPAPASSSSGNVSTGT
mmetsp:Transcript_26540/g.66963  ORF Transcript_26540/g.66963 Transcript_26540/m.66963 type:complete len:409 (-) Transcript_26540:1939-3165(-)